MPNPILLFLYSYYCIFVKVEKNALMEKISKNRKIIDWMYPGHLLELNETNWMVRTFIFQEKGGREGGRVDGRMDTGVVYDLSSLSPKIFGEGLEVCD